MGNTNDLFNTKINGWNNVDDEEKDKINLFCEAYKTFLDASKTERETIKNVKIIAEENGFKELSNYSNLNAGDKVYYINKEKNIFLGIIGEDDINLGLNLVVSHADSPRLDLKPNPLYEEDGFAYFKTHYYGSIKKYQWTAIPLALHGVVVKKNGEKVHLTIGEKDSDPVFTITDLLPHLAEKQMEQKLKDGISAENLNVLIGNIPLNNNLDSIKANVLKILNDHYNFSEMDFLSAEIELVPAFQSRDLGFDRSMIGGYGQDDRLSVYTALQAFLNIKNIKRTSLYIVSDKEEIGSLGNSSVETNAVDYFISLLISKIKGNYSTSLDEVLINSRMLCADVDVAMDPIYPSVFEKNNSLYLSKGVSISKYTGSNGKSNCSDANAEFVAFIRKIFEDHNIRYQTGEIGKVDAGGGGTIAYVFANKGIEVVDCGAPILSMHAPYEVSSKYDIYTSYKAYKAFFESY